MSGLIALLDDVAALAKVAAAQVDDIAAQATKVGVKTAGILIDDTAVTPNYVAHLPAARELPIVLKIARGSLFNKLVILLPAAMLLNAFAPWLLTPLLMLGGAYLCFEGGEKVLHVFRPASDHHRKPETLDQAHLEQARVAGAIKTDFILSAEIMTISLSAIEADGVWMTGAVLAVVAVGITVLVYGSVALLVKADDFGLLLSQIGRLRATRRLGRAIVAGMPGFLNLLMTVGTAAMLWVGGSIIMHGLDVLGWSWPYATIHHLAELAAHAVPVAQGVVSWTVTALLDGLCGLVLGFALIPVTAHVILPLAGIFSRKTA
jgi:predicted DNA repair protein MutK